MAYFLLYLWTSADDVSYCRTMPKKFLQRFMPDHHKIKSHRHLQFLGDMLHHQHLWHLNRRSVAGAFSVGLLVAFIPIPFQMVLAAILAIFFHTNLPISVSLVWLTNPVTMPALYYSAYKVGAWLLQMSPKRFHFELSFDWLMTSLSDVWQPFLLGCLILGVVCALLGNILMRLIWRIQVLRKREAQRIKRQQRDIDPI